jgi:hypothetical protein
VRVTASGALPEEGVAPNVTESGWLTLAAWLAVQVGLLPPLLPWQTQLTELPAEGKAGLLGLALPALHKAPEKELEPFG